MADDRLANVLGALVLALADEPEAATGLVAGGLAERRRGSDGRSAALVLTADGHRLAGEATRARRVALHDVLGTLDERERTELTALVEKLVGAVVARRLRARAAGVDPPGGWLCRLCDPVACGRPEGRCPAATQPATP